VRELENVMQRAVIFAAGDCVEVDALHLSVSALSTGSLNAAGATAVPSPLPDLLPAGGPKSDNMRDLERSHILETLAAVGGSRKLAGERLGMSERTLRHKLKQYRDDGLFVE